MTFQIFVGGQRVNSADVLNTPAWSHQVRLSPVTSRTCTHVSAGNAAAHLSLFDNCIPIRVAIFSSKTSRKSRLFRRRRPPSFARLVLTRTSLRHPARSPPQDKSRKRDFGEDEDASEYGNLRKKTSAASEHAPLAPVTNVALSAGK